MLQEGVLLAWRSADPLVQVQEVGGALAGRTVVSIAAGAPRSLSGACHARLGRAVGLHWCSNEQAACRGCPFAESPPNTCALGAHSHPPVLYQLAAGKYRTAAVTAEGDVYMFEGWSKPLDAAYAAAVGRHGGTVLPAAAASGGTTSSSLGRTPSQSMLGASPQGSSSANVRPNAEAHIRIHVTSCLSLVLALAKSMSAVCPTHRSSIDSGLRVRKNRTQRTLAHARQGVCDLVVTSFACTCC